MRDKDDMDARWDRAMLFGRINEPRSVRLIFPPHDAYDSCTSAMDQRCINHHLPVTSPCVLAFLATWSKFL